MFHHSRLFLFQDMKTLVLTGGIATGKSSLVRLLESKAPWLGFFDCDKEVHRLLTEPEILRTLREQFGDAIFASDQSLDRSQLRKLVFQEESNRRSLEALLHPKVALRCETARASYFQGSPDGVFVIDVPLYYETNTVFINDGVMVVATTPAIQLQRLLDRSQLNEPVAQAIVDAQKPITEKILLADILIWNDGPASLLEEQADLLLLTFPHPSS